MFNILMNQLCMLVLAAGFNSILSGNTLANQMISGLTAPQTGPVEKPQSGAAELLRQGKYYYRSARFKQALEKFEAALRIEPQNDEALGLAAVTAFRLDNQAQSREYFLKRASLPYQKDSVRAFSYYRIALTYWREVHDLVAKHAEIHDGRLSYKFTEGALQTADKQISSGLDYVTKALNMVENYAEAYNIKNLLHSEAALIALDVESARLHRDKAIEALRKALDLSDLSDYSKRGDAADFNQPTIRVSEFPRNDQEDIRFDDPMMRMLDGGRPISRIQTISAGSRRRAPAEKTDVPGIADTSSQVPTISFLTDQAKIEILISTTGDVVFAHFVDGKPELAGSAIMAARRWRFEPARFEGRPVQVSGVITFDTRSPRGR